MFRVAATVKNKRTLVSLEESEPNDRSRICEADLKVDRDGRSSAREPKDDLISLDTCRGSVYAKLTPGVVAECRFLLSRTTRHSLQTRCAGEQTTQNEI